MLSSIYSLKVMYCWLVYLFLNCKFFLFIKCVYLDRKRCYKIWFYFLVYCIFFFIVWIFVCMGMVFGFIIIRYGVFILLYLFILYIVNFKGKNFSDVDKKIIIMIVKLFIVFRGRL